jgi:multiple sugar transport system substrate-binding protein
MTTRFLKSRAIPVPVLVIMMLILAACSSTPVDLPQGKKPGLIDQEASTPEASIDIWDVKGPITLWSYYELNPKDKSYIQSRFPDVQISYRTVPADQAVSMYLQSSNTNQVDIYILKRPWLGHFNEIDLFEDLSKEPYSAKNLLGDSQKKIALSSSSFDESKLYALPLTTDPLMTYYRIDAMQNAGVPSEPEKLAEYIANPDQWLHIARTLKESRQWIVPWKSEPLSLATAALSMYDRTMNFHLDHSRLTQVIRTGWEIEKHGLASFDNIYIDSGKLSIAQGRTVMFYAGASFADELKSSAPELKGKWRMTELPFGLHALNHQDLIAISSRSANKSAAWALVRLLTENHQTRANWLQTLSYDHSLDPGDPYFGGQQTDVLQSKLLKELPEYKITPIDEKSNLLLWEIWNQYPDDKAITAEELAGKIQGEITRKYEREIQALKEILSEAK